jgi:hypothetical protein
VGGFRLRGEKVQTQSLGEELAHELAFHAISGRVEPWRENAEPALARGDRDHAAAYPLLPGKPVSYNQSPEFS